MRIPTKTKMLRNRKDSTSPSSSSTSTSTSTTTSSSSEGVGECQKDNCSSSHHLLHPNYSTDSSTNSSSLSSSPSSSSNGFPSSSSSSTNSSQTNSVPISLLRKKDLCVEDEFQILKTLSHGSFSATKIELAILKKDPTRSKVVIKGRASSLTPVQDFNREVELTYLLSPHPNVVTCYDVTFVWGGAFCFLQEYAPYGSLSKLLNRRRHGKTCGLGEAKTRLICSQVASALEFMHQLRLVHGSVTPSNILVFKSNCTLVKLADFSSTRTQGCLVVVKDSSSSSSFLNHQHQSTSFIPPELNELLPQEKYHVSFEQDSWQLGILACYLLLQEGMLMRGGGGPWEAADPLQDPSYRSYITWLKRKNLKVPEFLKNTTPRFIRLFKRLCEPKVGQRSGVRELRKYVHDPWLLSKRNVERSRSRSSTSAVIIRKTSDASTGSTVDCGETPQQEQNIDDVGVETLSSLGHLNLLSSEIDKHRKLEDWVKKSSIKNNNNSNHHKSLGYLSIVV